MGFKHRVLRRIYETKSEGLRGFYIYTHTKAFIICILFIKFQIKEGVMVGTRSKHWNNIVIRNQKPTGRPVENGNMHDNH
jgi:hypothetical protein